jgi:hypothetical protein
MNRVSVRAGLLITLAIVFALALKFWRLWTFHRFWE